MSRGRVIALAVCAVLTARLLPCVAAPAPGDSLPSFTLERMDGSALRWQPGRPAVLSFCRLWSDAWPEQSHRLSAVMAGLGGAGLDFISISVDGPWGERGEAGLSGELVLDSGGAFCNSLGIGSLPYTIVVDAQGRVMHATPGIVSAMVVEGVMRASAPSKPALAHGTVYLVFDDFPVPSDGAPNGLDDQLLEVLRAGGVRATFFCVGCRVKKGRALMRRALADRHSLQVHSWDHHIENPMIPQCVQDMREVTGLQPTIYHPPGRTSFTRINGRSLQLHVVNPGDYTRPGERELTRRVLLATKPGDVILLHVGVPDTIAALPEIIRSLRSRGLDFGVLE